jgi:hypothetical protein
VVITSASTSRHGSEASCEVDEEADGTAASFGDATGPALVPGVAAQAASRPTATMERTFAKDRERTDEVKQASGSPFGTAKVTALTIVAESPLTLTRQG